MIVDFFFPLFFSHSESRSLLAGGLFYVITLSEALVLTSEIIAAAVALLHSASLARAIRVALPRVYSFGYCFLGRIDWFTFVFFSQWNKCQQDPLGEVQEEGIEMSFHGAAKSNSSVPVWNYDS